MGWIAPEAWNSASASASRPDTAPKAGTKITVSRATACSCSVGFDLGDSGTFCSTAASSSTGLTSASISASTSASTGSDMARVLLRTAWSLGNARVGKGADASKLPDPSLSEERAVGVKSPVLNKMKSFGLRSVSGEVSRSASLMALFSCGWR